MIISCIVVCMYAIDYTYIHVAGIYLVKSIMNGVSMNECTLHLVGGRTWTAKRMADGTTEEVTTSTLYIYCAEQSIVRGV